MQVVKFHSGFQFWYEMISLIVLIFCSIKFLQLIRYNEAFCYLVEMLVQVTYDILPFLIILFTFTGVFVVVTDIIEGQWPDEDYKHMEEFSLIINLLQSFRNSIGDLVEPQYG